MPRTALLRDWLERQFPHFPQRQASPTWSIAPASADASFRRYFRVTLPDGQTRIVMDAPPEHEDCRPFVTVARLVREAGAHVPEVFAEDHALGFLLLSDLGTTTYLEALDAQTAPRLYRDANAALVAIQRASRAGVLPDYDEALLVRELSLFPDWYVARHLGVTLDAEQQQTLRDAFARILANNLKQPHVFVHRDYHSRNLMIVPGANPGIIDFQDAVIGPITYDLVSLLKDCYIQWPLARVYGWAESYRQRLATAGVVEVGTTRWRRWFDWMGLQRHLKVLGIFARLNYRDGKPGYLGDLPLVLDYTLAVCERYGELAPFGQWLEKITQGVDLTRAR